MDKTDGVVAESYCHLCDDMIAALENFRAAFSIGVDVEVIDIDRRPILKAKWGDKVTVLLGENRKSATIFSTKPGMQKSWPVKTLAPREQRRGENGWKAAPMLEFAR